MSIIRWLSKHLGWTSRAVNRLKSPARRPTFRPAFDALEERWVPSAGVLDPTFGDGAGYVTTSISTYSSGAEAVLIQPDSKIVAVGTAGLGTGNSGLPEDFAVVRYQADGSLDTSFGIGGHAVADFPGAAHGGRYSHAYAAALYPQAGTANDGKIIVVGEHDTKTGSIIALARFNADGTLDASFGNNRKHPGEVTTSFPNISSQTAYSVVVQNDGKIVVAGNSTNSLLLARYKTNGALDKTFGVGGEVVTSASGLLLHASTLFLQPDGKLFLVGDARSSSGPHVYSVEMARYNSNGSLDTSFGTGGLVTSSVTFGDHIAAALYPPGTDHAGEIAVVGQSQPPGQYPSPLEVARFTANGDLDTTFGTGGTVTGPLGSSPCAAVVDADGKLVVTYASPTSAYDSGHHFGVARYNTDGSPDNTFGTNGYVSYPPGEFVGGDLPAVALQANGDIVTAGWVFFTEYNQYYPNGVADSAFAVARFLPSAPQIGNFSATPNSDGSTTLTAANISDGNPKSTIQQVVFYYLDGSGNKVSLGNGVLNGAGTWQLTVTQPAGVTLYAQVKDSYGVFGNPMSLDL